MTPSINSLPELARQLRSGELPLQRYIEQLQAHFESREPSVLAYMPEPNRFERLQRDAESLVKKFPTPGSRPPLFGIPIGVKDIFHVDSFPTSGGSKLPPEVLKGEQAESVTLLKNAGALIFGKAVSTEFAYFGPGPTRNPHNPNHTPGGSSSGSAAAVGANLNPLTLGTQTIGSIIRPASFCGVVGFKPTYDRLSRAGVIPLSPSLDHIGFFTADAASANRVASVLLKTFKVSETLKVSPVLGVPEGAYLNCASEEGLKHFRSTCDRLRSAGCTIKSVEAMPDFEQIRARHNLIVAADAAKVHKDWFAQYGDLYHFKTVELIKRGQGVSDSDLAEALKGRGTLHDELTRLMNDHGIDIWLSPSAIGAATKGLDSTGDPVMNLPWTHCGFPAINLPSGFNAEKLPMGLQLTSRFNTDEELLAWAVEIEKVLMASRSVD
jgi:Asp-tRNA(Asn)/Glu-tRNA(Gln) amidotransferase A subunit family amidase